MTTFPLEIFASERVPSGFVVIRREDQPEGRAKLSVCDLTALLNGYRFRSKVARRRQRAAEAQARAAKGGAA